MLSYREHLRRIGIGNSEAVSYLDFASRPPSLRQAIRSMKAPSPGGWKQESNVFYDEFWTDEVQGLAWNGSHWIFCANARQAKPDSEDKAIYVFEDLGNLRDDSWITRIKFHEIPHPIADTTESDCHWGQLTYHEGFVYVAHFWEDGPKKGIASAVRFRSEGGGLSFDDWIELEQPVVNGGKPRNEFQAINPWDGLLYSYHAGIFFMHDPETGQLTGGTLELEKPVNAIQGACFSPNGHLYIASNDVHEGREFDQTVWYFSALNGHRFGVFPVPAQEEFPDHELEGICFADVELGGDKKTQIHAILLENPDVALDNVFVKSFSAAEPELV